MHLPFRRVHCRGRESGANRFRIEVINLSFLFSKSAYSGDAPPTSLSNAYVCMFTRTPDGVERGRNEAVAHNLFSTRKSNLGAGSYRQP